MTAMWWNRGWGLRIRQGRRWQNGGSGWAAWMYVRDIGSQHIIVSDWVGGVHQMPRVALTINLNAEGRMNMYAHLPDVCSHNNLLLSAPDTVVQSFSNVCHVTEVGVLRPKASP